MHKLSLNIYVILYERRGLMMQKKDYIDIIVFGIIFVIFTAILMSFEAVFDIDTESQWIGFYGNLLGGLLGALIALRIMNRQILVERKNIDNDRKEKYRIDIEISVMKEIHIVLKQLKQSIDNLYNVLLINKEDEDFISTIKYKFPKTLDKVGLDLKDSKVLDNIRKEVSEEYDKNFREGFRREKNFLLKCYTEFSNLFDTYKIVLEPEVAIAKKIMIAYGKIIKFSIEVIESEYDQNIIYEVFNDNSINSFNDLYESINLCECKIQTRVLGKLFNSVAIADDIPRYNKIL